jgi:hypothetical protein
VPGKTWLLVSVMLCSVSYLLIMAGMSADKTGIGVLIQVADITALLVVGAAYLFNRRAAKGRVEVAEPSPAPARSTSRRVEALTRKYAGYKVEL